MAYKPSLAEFLYTNADSNVDVMYRELMRAQDQTPESTSSVKPPRSGGSPSHTMTSYSYPTQLNLAQSRTRTQTLSTKLIS